MKLLITHAKTLIGSMVAVSFMTSFFVAPLRADDSGTDVVIVDSTAQKVVNSQATLIAAAAIASTLAVYIIDKYGNDSKMLNAIIDRLKALSFLKDAAQSTGNNALSKLHEAYAKLLELLGQQAQQLVVQEETEIQQDVVAIVNEELGSKSSD